jgi:hypothetical protein
VLPTNDPFARRHINDGGGVEGQAPCPAGATPIESIAHFMYKCPVTTAARAHMNGVVNNSLNGEPFHYTCCAAAARCSFIAFSTKLSVFSGQ